MIYNEKKYLFGDKFINKIQTLIIGRLLVTFLIMVAGWLWSSGHFNLKLEDFPTGLLLIFLISVGLTIVYFFLLRLSKNLPLQVRTQFFIDSIIITCLVWLTGDLTSPYITLYIVLICVASLFLNARQTLLTAVLCVSLFSILSVLTTTALIYSSTTSPETSRAIQIIAFHDVAFLVVGLLAAKLSERRASGEQLQEATKTLANLRVLHERIVESIRSGLITTDLTGKIYTFNTAAEEITGYSSEDMIGNSVFSLLGNIEQSFTPALETTETGQQPLRFQTDLKTPEGFVVHVGYGISPLFTETGETTGLIITFQDLTEIRSMEESVRRKDKLAAVGRVAAGLAHEIRNPLGAMRGAIQVLQAQTPPETAQASLMEIILRESDRLNKIISNFLTYARPRVSNFSEIDVRETISDTFVLLRHSPDIKENHVLEFDEPPKAVNISADPTQLKQIFWNLARNSIQAMPSGGKLSIRLNKLINQRVQIIFQDTGCGMPPEQVEQLFEPFSTSTTGGTGLGLSIVYQIVRDHGGTINVRSLEGSGTTITIELPIEYKNTSSEDDEKENPALVGSRLENFLTVQQNENKISS